MKEREREREREEEKAGKTFFESGEEREKEGEKEWGEIYFEDATGRVKCDLCPSRPLDSPSPCLACKEVFSFFFFFFFFFFSISFLSKTLKITHV